MRSLGHITGLLASTEDGLAAWRSFVRGVEAHVSGQQSLLAMIAIGLGLLALVGVNVWVARKLLGSEKKPGSARDSGR